MYAIDYAPNITIFSKDNKKLTELARRIRRLNLDKTIPSHLRILYISNAIYDAAIDQDSIDPDPDHSIIIKAQDIAVTIVDNNNYYHARPVSLTIQN